MAKHLICILFLLMIAVNPIYSQPVQTKNKPNIIFILVDDMGWNGISSFGNPHVETPNIDQLANQGMKFTQAYTPPECTPSRAEFLSGEYGARTHITQVHASRVYPNAPLMTPKPENKLPDNNYTVANMLRDAGYVTMISGKWHVGDDYRVAALKAKYGDQYFDPYGFDYVGTAMENDWNEIDTDKANMDIVDDFFTFIDQNPKRSFFAYLPFFSIHTPLDAPDSLIQKFVKRGFPRSIDRFADASQKPTADYLAVIEFLDYAIGNMLDRLDETGLDKTTMIVLMSDNGALDRAWDNCPLRGAKGVLHEGGIRVPLLVRWPGTVAPASQSDTPVNIVDMYATFKEIVGGSVPDTKILDGVSLLPLLTQHGKFPNETLYWHHPHYIHDYGQTPSSAIREGNFKLIHYYGDYLDTKGYMPVRGKPYGHFEVGERIELFNVEDDPFEQHDLSKKFPEKAGDLLNSLNKQLSDLKSSMPRPNPDMDTSNWYRAVQRKNSN